MTVSRNPRWSMSMHRGRRRDRSVAVLPEPVPHTVAPATPLPTCRRCIRPRSVCPASFAAASPEPYMEFWSVGNLNSMPPTTNFVPPACPMPDKGFTDFRSYGTACSAMMRRPYRLAACWKSCVNVVSSSK